MKPGRVQRRTKTQALFQAGHSISDIARQLEMSRNTVKKWIRKPDDDVQDAKRSGRPSKLSPRAKLKIRNMIMDKVGVGTRTATKKLNFCKDYQEINKIVSRSTVQKYVRSTPWGKHAYVQAVKPLLSEKNVKDRLSFCKRLEDEGFCSDDPDGKLKRAHILFTDESPIELNPTPNKQNMRIRTSDPTKLKPVAKPKQGLKIMVAGGISCYGRTELHVVDSGKTVNGDYYRNFIIPIYNAAARSRRIFPRPEMIILQQDGAKPHTARETYCLLESKRIFPQVWKDWPGNSPDLNPVEHMWAHLQESVFCSPRPRNREELIRRVKEAWNSYPQDTIAKMTDSFGRRLQECLDKNGFSTHY